MRNLPLPFQPIRGGLYSSTELMEGFDPHEPQSMRLTKDFQIFEYYVREGRSRPSNQFAGMMQALHDQSILGALVDLLTSAQRPVAAVMGGHSVKRNEKPYQDIARLSKLLSKAGFLLASGGGPGIMEATHLGALLAQAEDDQLSAALEQLARVPAIPPSLSVINPQTYEVDDALVRKLHEWALPAHSLVQGCTSGGQSLGIPTWYYGHEPFTPLASTVAKFFQNSIREDVLLALATNGVIYAPGKAGTLQEIFQDAAQNFYHSEASRFSPMVFLDVTYWTETLPVKPLLQALFKSGAPPVPDEFEQRVLFTNDVEEAVSFLTEKQDLDLVHLHERLAALGLS
jgi:predicted Rossmann-fold nucleotide-binding protein